VRGDLLGRAGRAVAAAAAFRQAAALSRNVAEQRLLLERAAELD
jgi:predicted RNA polymerase sigma factor